VADPKYSDPKLAINKVYTKTGDLGKTSLVGGQRVKKHHERIETYGTVDELNAFLGAAAISIQEEAPAGEARDWILETLNRVQHELFNLGAILATLPEDVHPSQPQIREPDIRRLEADIDRCNAELPPLRSFVLPGGSRANADLHICRTVCRRAERWTAALGETEAVPPEAVKYLNRLSDAFFVWSRWINKLLGREETLWQPNKAASAST